MDELIIWAPFFIHDLLNPKYAINILLRGEIALKSATSLLFSISPLRCYAKISKQTDFLAIATLPVNTGQALPLTIVRARKSYYIIRVEQFKAGQQWPAFFSNDFIQLILTRMNFGFCV
ncbi:hypothetical protein [Cyclobacterium amurskyense]|uniref:hypothetical protein n=1 Tax=Cyclobacterium amurskyense TaxID=320787 RepID=UPI0030DA2D26